MGNEKVGPLPSLPVTIPELARRLKIPRASAFRDIHKLHRQCQDGTCGADRAKEPEHRLWLYRPSTGPWCVNLSRLRAEHPERYPGPDIVELGQRVEAIETHARHTRKQVNALAAAFREHAAAHKLRP